MKEKFEYICHRLEGKDYRIPYGQAQGERKESLQLNESAAILWEAFAKDKSLEEIITEYSHVTKIKESAMEFQAFLYEQGILEKPVTFETFTQGFSIADLNLLYLGIKEHMHPSFQDFALAKAYDAFHKPIDMRIQVLYGKPKVYHQGRVILRSDEVIITEAKDEFIMIFLKDSALIEGRITKDGHLAVFHTVYPIKESLCHVLFHGIRFAFLLLAQKKAKFALHSASILYKEKLWLFSAQSGGGKSTHSGLWHNILKAPLINGDVNCLGIEAGNVYCYGQPWCGTSDIYSPHNYPVGGIVFLSQGPKEQVSPLSHSQKVLMLNNRLISPAWTKEQAKSNLTFAEKVAKKVPILYYSCTMEPSAVTYLQTIIDNL